MLFRGERACSMKAAVITLKDSPNYGGILQAYALQKVVEGYGHECVLIDYMNDEFRQKFTFFGKPEGMANIYWLFKKAQYPLMRIMMKKLMPFYRHMKLTRKFENKEQLKELNNEPYDVFITGSDQVWACDLNRYDDSYFLSFVKDKARIAYAASFGRTLDMLTPGERGFISAQLDRLDYIGVRERSGVDIVRDLSGRGDAVSVLDPTLLLGREDWEQVASHEHRGAGKRYILCYLMQSRKNDSEALRVAKAMSRKTGMPIVKICRGLTSVLWGETAYVPTVEEWLGLFMDAEYIFTNSFHGMAFSVNFEKDFTVFLEGDPKSGRNSRVYDRCRDLGLESRIKVVGDGSRIETSQIDYTSVSRNLGKLKGDSNKFLVGSIDGCWLLRDRSMAAGC